MHASIDHIGYFWIELWKKERKKRKEKENESIDNNYCWNDYLIKKTKGKN